MIEGSGSGSIPLTVGSGSGRPKNMWIRIRIWIRNTAKNVQNRRDKKIQCCADPGCLDPGFEFCPAQIQGQKDSRIPDPRQRISVFSPKKCVKSSRKSEIWSRMFIPGKKRYSFFQLYFFLQFLVIETLDPDPNYLKMWVPDPYLDSDSMETLFWSCSVKKKTLFRDIGSSSNIYTR